MIGGLTQFGNIGKVGAENIQFVSIYWHKNKCAMNNKPKDMTQIYFVTFQTIFLRGIMSSKRPDVT